jgi:uncharacterized protein YggT (Ycf19 family)
VEHPEHHHVSEPVGAEPRPVVATGPVNHVRAVQLVWFITGLVDVLVALRFGMKLLGASTVSEFTRFIYGVSEPLVAPFRGIFPTTGQGTYILEPASLVAIVIYALIGWGIVSLIVIMSTRGTRSVT